MKTIDAGLSKPIKDRRGERFGKLVLIDFSHRKNQPTPANKWGKKYYWKCKCDCGAIITTGLNNLMGGNKTSCGCIKKGKESHKWKGYEDIPGWVWCKIRSNAKRRGLELDIDLEYLWEIWLEQDGKCVLSGQPLRFEHERLKALNQTSSLDRIDSTKGYIKGNVQWVHKDLQAMKWDKPEDVFFNLCRKVTEHKDASTT